MIRSKELTFNIKLHFECFQGVEKIFNTNLSANELNEEIKEIAENEEYFSFIESIALNMRMLKFEYLENLTFNNEVDDNSCYFTMYRNTGYVELIIKFIFNLKISDQRPSQCNSDELPLGITEYFINDKTFTLFRSAIKHICNTVRLEMNRV